MTLQEAIIRYVKNSIKRGGSTGNTGTINGWIDLRVYKTLKTMKTPAPLKKPRNLAEYIENEVSKYVAGMMEEASEHKFPASGYLSVTSVVARMGTVLGYANLGEVSFVSVNRVEVGGVYPYVYNGKTFTLQHGDDGAVSKAYGGPASSYNVITRQGNAIEFVQMDRPAEAVSEIVFDSVDSTSTFSDKKFWFSPDGLKIGYVADGKYRETADYNGASTTDLEIDIAEHISAASTPSNVTWGNKTFTRSWLSHRPVKILFHGNTRFIILAKYYYWYNTSFFIDKYWGIPGTLATNVWELVIYDMLVLDVPTKALVSTHKVTHSDWNGIMCHSEVHVGYLDVQECVTDSDKVLVLKSGSTPSFKEVDFYYYSDPSPEAIQADPEAPFVILDTPNGTKTTKILQVSYDLVGYTVGTDSTLTIDASTVYHTDGNITSYKSTPVDAGVHNMGFTQQPQSGNIYLYQFITAYKQQPDYIAVRSLDSYTINAVDFYRIIDTSDTVYYTGLARQSGKLETVCTYQSRLSNPTIFHYTNYAFVYTGVCRYAAEAMMYMFPDDCTLFDTRPGDTYNNEIQRILVSSVDGVMARFSNVLTREHTYLGTASFSSDYAMEQASHLLPNRFIALTDLTNPTGDPKFFWVGCKETILAMYETKLITEYEGRDLENPYVARVSNYDWAAYEHTPYFFKPDTDTAEMDVFFSAKTAEQVRAKAMANSSPAERKAAYDRVRGLSQRSFGMFYSAIYDGEIETEVLADSVGWNNLAIAQLSDSEVLINVQGIFAEILYDFDYNVVSSETKMYDRFVLYFVCNSGSLSNYIVFTNEINSTMKLVNILFVE